MNSTNNAYIKIEELQDEGIVVFHVLKHTHELVNGILEGSTVEVATLRAEYTHEEGVTEVWGDNKHQVYIFRTEGMLYLDFIDGVMTEDEKAKRNFLECVCLAQYAKTYEVDDRVWF